MLRRRQSPIYSCPWCSFNIFITSSLLCPPLFLLSFSSPLFLFIFIFLNPRPPFTAFNQKELAGKIREGRFRRIPYRYSDGLNDLITQMLNLKVMVARHHVYCLSLCELEAYSV